MKRGLILSLMLGGAVIALPAVDANAAVPAVASSASQVVLVAQPGRRWRSRRTVTRTRITRVGMYRFRETIRVTYLPNGRTRTQVIRRVRLGRWSRG